MNKQYIQGKNKKNQANRFLNQLVQERRWYHYNKNNNKSVMKYEWMVEEADEEKHPGKKYLYNRFDTYLLAMLEEGFIFFGVTVNFLNAEPKVYECPRRKRVVKKFGQYLDSFTWDCHVLEFIEVVFGMMENNAEGTHPHAHLLLGFRAISNDVRSLKKHIQNKLGWKYLDMRIDYLPHEKDIKQFFVYLTKEIDQTDRDDNRWDHSVYTELYKEKLHDYYFGVPISHAWVPHLMKGLIRVEGYQGYDFKDNGLFTRSSTLYGYKFDKEESSVFLSIYYLSLYFQIKDIFLYKEGLYQKVEGSLISYKYLGDLRYFQDQVGDYLNELGEMFESLNVHEIHKHFLTNIEMVMKRMYQIARFVKRKLDYNLLEFKDGIYLAEYNRFLSREEASTSVELTSSVTTRYYDYLYTSIRGVDPTCWHQKISVHFEEEEKFREFCIHFGAILFQFPEESKQKALFLLGRSGAGKTQLVIQKAMEAYGEHNSGAVMFEDITFALSNVFDKDFISVDEVSFHKRLRSMFLKLTGREKVLVNRKYQEPELKELTQSIIFSGNPSKELETMLSDDAFLKRINLYLFREEVDLTQEERREIEREIPLILIYCARIRYKKQFNTRHYTRKQFKVFKERYLTSRGKRGTPQNPPLLGPSGPKPPQIE